jgi:hypothetical protein
MYVGIAAVCALFLALVTPTILVATDAFAQEGPETKKAETKPAAKVAPKPAPKVAAKPKPAAKKAEPKKAAPKVTAKGEVTVTDTKKEEAKPDEKVEPKAEAKVETKEEPKTEKEQSWWQPVLAYLLSAFGMILAGFLVGGLRKLVQLMEKKWNIDVPDQVERIMYDKARWLVAWAEEKAENRLLNGDGVKTPGAEKAADVIGEMEKFAEGMGYGDEWRKDKIEKLVDAVLHLSREGSQDSIGSNGSRGTKLEEKKNGNS